MPLDDKARERVVCAAVALATPAWSSERALDVARLAPLGAATAAVFDGDGVVDRFEHSDYPAIARSLLRAASGLKGRAGKPRSGSSLRELASEVDGDSDRDTSRDRGALKNRRRRAVLFALTALGCAGDITEAVDAAEPLSTSPKPRV